MKKVIYLLLMLIFISFLTTSKVEAVCGSDDGITCNDDGIAPVCSSPSTCQDNGQGSCICVNPRCDFGGGTNNGYKCDISGTCGGSCSATQRYVTVKNDGGSCCPGSTSGCYNSDSCVSGPTSTPTPGGGGGDLKKCGDLCRNKGDGDYDCDGDENGTNDSDKGEVLSCAPNVDPEKRVCWNSKCGGDNPPACSLPNKPTLQSPNNNDRKTDKTPTFNWSNVNKPASCNWVKYHIQVKKGNNNGDNIINKSGLTNSTCTAGGSCPFLSGKSIVAGESYFWRVQASTSKGNSDWTGFWKYTVTSTGPTNTPAPNATATPTPPGPTPTVNPNCSCNSSNECSSDCNTFETFDDVTYDDPIKCSVVGVSFFSEPTTDERTGWCQRNLRTKGDVDGNGLFTENDYFYYVSAANGGKIPAKVNVDVDGDGKVSTLDRSIIIRSQPQN